MQITKLRLAGFKSFVQPTELAVEPGLTGIVGPNGCGKSNLIDALRWVMGETSARGLRGGEMDDVIFAGTAARPAYDLAEVGLRIQAPGVALPGLGEVDELDLARRIGRGVGSVFRVNGKELRARDVQLLFADAASGARSAAIVGQGQIGALIEAKPVDRRRLIEEAAGVGGLQARRHEAELKLQAAEANLVRVQDLLLALEEQHQGLVRQARQAERYRKLSAAYREVEAALLVGRWQLARAELAVAGRALQDGRAGAESQAGRLSAARLESERASQALAQLRAAEAVLATELARLTERRGVLDDEAARLDATRAQLAERDRQMANDVTHGEAALEDARATEQRLAAERLALAQAGEQHARDLERAARAEAEAAATARVAEAELRQALTRVAEAEARRQQLTDRRAEALRDRDALAAAARTLGDRLGALGPPAMSDDEPVALAALEAELETATRAQAAAEAALEAADRQREASRTALQAASARLGQEKQREQAQQAERQRLQDQRQRLAERQAELDQRRNRLAERLAEAEARAAAGAARRAALDLAGFERQLAAAEQQLADSAAALEAAGAVATAAAEAHERARDALQTRRAALDRLQAEAAALAELAGPRAGEPSVLDDIRVEDGYAEALAAALGDDLIASLDPAAPSHWRLDLSGDRAGHAPALPPGCRPLAEVVAAPPALARRLAQVGVVAAAGAAAMQADLAQGQRLVSQEGGLWRWDGLVRRPEARDGAAALLRRKTRRRQLEALLADEHARLEQAEQAAGNAAAAASAAAAGRQRASATESGQRDACERQRAATLQARAEAAALSAELDAVANERSTLEAELAEVDDLRRSALGQLQDAAATTVEELGGLDTELSAAGAAEAAAVGQDRQAETAQAACRVALADARAKLGAARDTLERRRAATLRSAADARERELARAQIAAEHGRLAAEQAARTTTMAELGSALDGAEAQLATARAQLGLAEQANLATRAALAEASMQHARLRDRQTAALARASTLEQELALWSQRAHTALARLEELALRRSELAAELARLEHLPGTLRQQRAELAARLAETEARRATLGVEIAACEAALGMAQATLEQTEAARVEAREAAARLEARLERAQAESEAAEAAARARLGEAAEADPATAPAAAALAELEIELGRIGGARERLGPVNLRAIDEARELQLRIETLQAEQAELTGAIERLRRAILTLNREGRERLRAAFAKVEIHFEALFTRLFGGGRARLTLTDPDDPLAAGLELAASPPGKKLQSISLLSGGEKALTALALIFAVFLTKPAPLCVLDEVDAPLDDANVDRLMTLLEELAEGTRTRFMVITHHPLTMARMHRLYGVTMAERGISQLVSVDLSSAIELRASA